MNMSSIKGSTISTIVANPDKDMAFMVMLEGFTIVSCNLPNNATSLTAVSIQDGLEGKTVQSTHYVPSILADKDGTVNVFHGVFEITTTCEETFRITFAYEFKMDDDKSTEENARAIAPFFMIDGNPAI